MQKYKVSFKGQNIYVGIDVHLKTWHVTTLTESGCKYSFSQHADAKELFDRLNKKFPEAHFKSAYEAGFCGFSAHYALTEQGIENIVVHAADIPTTGKEKALKTDAVDSEKIAWALKRGELTGIYIKDKRYMDDTNLMRLRQRFIMDLSRQKNRTKHLLYTQGVTYPERFRKNSTHWSRNFMKWLREEVELLSEQDDGAVELPKLCDATTQQVHLARVLVGLRLLVGVDVHRQRHGLVSSLLSVERDADVQADAVDPGAHIAAFLKRGQALPQVDEHLLEQVGHLVLVVGEHVADGVYRAAVLPDHLFKFTF